MIFRPDRRRVATTAIPGFILGMFPAMSSRAPDLMRVLGVVIVIAVVGYLIIISRTWISVDGPVVEVGVLRGIKRFQAGSASVRTLAVPGGPIRNESALHIESTAGRATIALASFSRADQHEVVDAVRRALESER